MVGDVDDASLSALATVAARSKGRRDLNESPRPCCRTRADRVPILQPTGGNSSAADQNTQRPAMFLHGQQKMAPGRSCQNVPVHHFSFRDESFLAYGGSCARLGGVGQMGLFERIEALIETPEGDDPVGEVRSLLRQVTGGAAHFATAAEDFMLDFVTVVFVIEWEREQFHRRVQALARIRLAKIRILARTPILD
jgi:hypothetical protein